jgi:hypothetical protein
MEDKVVLEDLLEVKKYIDQMDLLEFKTQWDKRSEGHTTLKYADRLKFMVMSIKVLQAKVDLIRTISSIKECSTHPEPERAIYYYLRSNLWKFLDSFQYALLTEDISDQVKLECMDLLDEFTEIIAQDEQLKNSCLHRLHKLLAHVRILENEIALRKYGMQASQIHAQLDQRISKLIYTLEPSVQAESVSQPLVSTEFTPQIQQLIKTYASFSVSRISIEKSGVLSIIQLLHEHLLVDIDTQKIQLEETLTTLDQQMFYSSTVTPARNQCAYALVILLEILKMHKGLPVLLLKILELCVYIHFPPAGVDIERELRELKRRVTDVSQKKLRPIIEDVIWKNPEYFANIPYLRSMCPWCYDQSPEHGLDINLVRRVIASSFDRLLSTQQGAGAPDIDTATSQLSKTVIETLGLLVNIEPSPQFLKSHAKETLIIKRARESNLQPGSMKQLLDKQYTIYKNHLKFLHDSIEYYQALSENLAGTAEG